MAISESILPEFDQEMASTRKLIERVPNDKFDYKPHDKSYSMGELASHLVNIPTWVDPTLNQDSIDVSGGFETPQAKSADELVKLFDDAVEAARKTIAETSDAVMMESWSLKNGDQALFTMPKVVVMRSFIMNHLIHHRAQLTVYLRMNDVPLPAIYGPSADDQGM